MKRISSYIVTHPQLSIIYGLLGILGLLLILLVVNEKNWRPLKGKPTWKVTSNFSANTTTFAIDRNSKTQWSSYVPMSFGMFFQVDITTLAVINGLVLDAGEDRDGQPTEWVVKTSLDGENWQETNLQRHINYRSMLAILFDPVRARYIQIILTADSSSEWLIYELDLLRPIVPWQFERSTLMFWILGCVFTLVSALLFIPNQISSWKEVIRPVVIILIVLLGWFLRVYDINSYELSDKELKYFSLLDFGRYTHAEWLQGFFQSTEMGTSWLAFLLSRWTYQVSSNYLVSLRIVPAIFGVCTVFLVCLIWNIFFSERQTSPYHRQGVVREELLASALISLSGFPIWLSRRGDFSVILVFFILLYLAVAYHFLYRKGSYGWVVVLILLAFTGFFIDPAMGYVPIGVIVFSGLSLFLPFRDVRLKEQALRVALYLIAVLPLGGYWYLSVTKAGNKALSLSPISFDQKFFNQLSQALTYSGFTGIISWVLWGIVLVGIVQLIYYRNHGEWFLYIQGTLFSILVLLFSSPENSSSPSLLLTVLILFLLVKGIHTILFLFFFRSKRQKPDKHPGSDRLTKHYSIARTVVLIGIGLYFTLFSFNSLFFGYPAYPYASAMYEEYSQEKRIGKLVRHITTDPDECKSVGILDQSLSDFYPTVYKIDAYFVELSGLKRLAEWGRFWTYIFAPISLENPDKEKITRFLNQYYTELGKSTQVVLYKLRDEFYEQHQHYSSRYLFSDIGRHIEDESSSSGWVRYATKEDFPGILSVSPAYRTCQRGRYTARFALRSPGDTDEIVAILEVIANRYNSLLQLEVKGSDFVAPTAYQIINLPFDLDMTDNPAFQMKRLQLLVHFTGKSEVKVDYIELIPEKL